MTRVSGVADTGVHPASCVVIVVAAGSGRRFGSGIPKQYQLLLDAPLLLHTLRRLHDHPRVRLVVPVIAPDGEEYWQRRIGPYLDGLPRVMDPVVGGQERQHSVYNGLRHLVHLNVGPEDWVAIHDGVRPLFSPDLINRLLDGSHEAPEARIAALPAQDTIKQSLSASSLLVGATLDRSRIWLAQTPQLFRYATLVRAHKQAYADGFIGTDDAHLVERLGIPVGLVPGEVDNIKVTTPADMQFAGNLLRGLRQQEEGTIREDPMAMVSVGPVGPVGVMGAVRTGQGIDVHRWVEGRPLMLGGVEIPHSHGLLGHSDADALLHAVCDALLGAAGLGDIGDHFPDRDPEYAGIDSKILLQRVVGMVHAMGWRVVNVDSTVLCQAPKLAPWREIMCQTMAGLLEVAPDAVNVKATTTELLGFVGREEGLLATATATIQQCVTSC